MSIRSGVYRLRVGPASGVGGMFATRGSIGEPISVAPATPEFMERQAWFLKQHPEEQDLWHILTVPSTGVGAPGWACKEIRPEAPVLLIPEPRWFRLQKQEGGTYSMTAEGGPIGVRWAVIPGEDGSREVQLKPFPIELPVEVPGWELIPAN